MQELHFETSCKNPIGQIGGGVGGGWSRHPGPSPWNRHGLFMVYSSLDRVGVSSIRCKRINFKIFQVNTSSNLKFLEVSCQCIGKVAGFFRRIG